jgi:hypothetical protein
MRIMKKMVLLVLTTGLAFAAHAADKVTIQLKWVTQAQFGGYYVAQDKGYYSAAGLDVTIKPGGPDIATPQVIAGGGADVIIDWMPSALASREKGVALVNISQIFKKIRNDAYLPKRQWYQISIGFSRENTRSMVLWKRISFSELDESIGYPNQRWLKWSKCFEAGFQR